MVLPQWGLVSEILPVFARKPLFGYRAMVFSIIAIGFLGFIVWGHHMFVSGMNLYLSAGFSISTMVIRGALGHQGVQLDGHDLERQHPLHDQHELLAWRS